MEADGKEPKKGSFDNAILCDSDGGELHNCFAFCYPVYLNI